MYLSPEHNRQVAEKLFRHIRDNSTDMIEEIYEYPLSVYSDPDIAIAERDKIFEHYPMMALHGSQLPESGSYVTVKLNRSEALVTRAHKLVYRPADGIPVLLAAEAIATGQVAGFPR